jgi:signal transduction histidine kinase
MTKRAIASSIILFLVVAGALFGADAIGKRDRPRAEKGVIDLAGWDFERRGLVSLGGEWKFHWGELGDPAAADERVAGGTDAEASAGECASGCDDAYAFIVVPGVWNAQPAGYPKWPATGFATYELTVLLGDAKGPLGLRIQEMSTAYELFVDGERLVSSGRVGRDRATSSPELLPKTVVFTPRGRTVRIVVHFSNHWSDRGGLWKDIRLGTADRVLRDAEDKKGFDFFVAGALIVICIYHVILSFLWRGNLSAFLFGLFCFLMAVRSVITGERLLFDFIPYFGWNVAQRIELLTSYLGVPVFTAFLRSLYPAELGKKIVRTFQVLGIAWSVVVLAVDSAFLSFTFDLFQFVLFVVCGYSVYGLVRARIARRYGAGIFLIGVCILAAAIINDILHAQFLIHTAFITPAGLVLGVFFSEVALNVHFVRTEQARKESEEKSSAILEAIPDSMFRIGRNGTVIDFVIKSDIWDVFLVPPDEGMNVSIVFRPEVARGIAASIVPVLESGRPDIRTTTIAGGDRELHLEVRTVKSGDERILVILRDITDRVKAEEELRAQEEQLIQAEKLASLGTLTAGVAHEINNPNNAILLAAQVNEEAFARVLPVLDEAVADAGPVDIGGFSYDEFKTTMAESFSRTIRNSRRIKRIVDDLKSFAGKDSGALDQSVDLDAVVESALRLLESVVKKKAARFSFVPAEGLPAVKGNGQRIEQVVVNIVQNALHALPEESGLVVVSTVFDECAGEASVVVADDGVGMDEETKRRIFDPFFTTRRSSGGTGLGLAISARIVADHGGRIEIESEKGRGTTVRVVFPVPGRTQA